MNNIINESVLRLASAVNFFQVETIINDALLDHYDTRHFGLQKIAAIKDGISLDKYENDRNKKTDRMKSDVDGVRHYLFSRIHDRMTTCVMYTKYKEKHLL